MKFLITILMFICSFMTAQTYEIRDGRFYTIVKDGLGKEHPVQFTVTDSTISQIMESEAFHKFLNDKSFIQSNKEKRGMSDEITVFLFSEVNSAVMTTQANLKNRTSFKVEDNSEGSIRYDEKGLTITIPFSAKNDVGANLIKRSVVRDHKAIFIN